MLCYVSQYNKDNCSSNDSFVLGSEIVDWLFGKVQGFSDRREAKKYSMQMLKVWLLLQMMKIVLKRKKKD